MSALVDALGWRKAADLAKRAGGRTLRVPSMASDRNSTAARDRLIALVGADLAADLVTAFARTRVYVPRGPSPHNSRACPIDVQAVHRLTRQGLTAVAIADRLGCTVRTVHKKRATPVRRRKP